MKLGGLQKTSLIDYPDKICAIVWTVGCNFRCPFCYNPQLVQGTAGKIAMDELFDFLRKRVDVLDAVSITGGEPLLHEDITEFIEQIKQLGYLVKVDTNGSFPTRLEQLLEAGLVDYVAMDIKAPPEKYETLTGVPVDIATIQQSIDIIKDSAPGYEFRTTCIPTLLDKQDFTVIADWLKPAKRYYIQQFKPMESLLENRFTGVQPYDNEYLNEIVADIRPYFTECAVRGV